MAATATYGYGRSLDWETAVDDALAMCEPLPSRPDLALVYITDYLTAAADDIRARVIAATGAPRLAGSVGIGVCCTRRELMDEAAVVVLLLADLDGAVDVVVGSADGEVGPVREDAAVALVHANPSGGALLQPGSPIADLFLLGGVASSRMPIVQLHTGGTTDSGSPVVVLGDGVRITSGLTQGCTPIGPLHHVTEAVDQLLVTLDGRPALEVLLEEVGPEAAEDMQRLAGRVFVGAQLPNRDRHDYAVRQLLGYDEKHGVLAVAHRFREGDALQFTRRDAASAKVDLERMVQELARRHGAPPTAGVYFSCVARGSNLWDDPSVELDAIADALGDFPLVGFFGNGEIAADQVYGFTGVLALFG